MFQDNELATAFEQFCDDRPASKCCKTGGNRRNRGRDPASSALA
jgi:hypothetical protein